MAKPEGLNRLKAGIGFRSIRATREESRPLRLFSFFPFPSLAEPALPSVSVRLVVDPSGRLSLPPATPSRWVDGFIARAQPSFPEFRPRVRCAVKTGALIAHFSLRCLVGFFGRVFPSENPCYTTPHARTRSPQSLGSPVYGWDSPADVGQ